MEKSNNANCHTIVSAVCSCVGLNGWSTVSSFILLNGCIVGGDGGDVLSSGICTDVGIVVTVTSWGVFGALPLSTEMSDFVWRLRNLSHGSTISFDDGVCCELIGTKKHLSSPNVTFRDSNACCALHKKTIIEIEICVVWRGEIDSSEYKLCNISLLAKIMQQHITI